MMTRTFNYGRAWFWASRPFSLSAAVVPVLVGSAVAAKQVNISWLLFAFALVGSLAIQIGTNLTDEYADHRREGGQAKFPAPHKVLARGLLTEKEVLIGCILTFAVGIGMGLYIVTEVGWPILALGLGSVFVAVFYSAGPKPLGDTGLGEATVFFFMGPLMVVAAYYVQTQELAWAPFWASMPVAFLVTAILHCNNLRDVEEDRESGKRTFVTMLGPGAGRVIYVGFLGVSYGSMAIVSVVGVVSIWGLVGLASVVWAFLAARRVLTGKDRREMSMGLVKTAKLHGQSGMFYAAGLGGAVVFG